MRYVRYSRLALSLALLALLPATGCVSLTPNRIDAQPIVTAAPPATVFCADGAGNFQTSSLMLRTVAHNDGYPIEVITHEWSHGYLHVISDQVDYPYALLEGKKLAALVLEYHQYHPEQPIYLYAHSAGAMVVLVALEELPPNVVERAILLAPSVSAEYDVRPALRGVKKSLDVFCSKRDTWYLGTITHILGNSDRVHTPTAGVVGFRPMVHADDVPLLDKLVHHRWQPSDRELGHNGGHFGAYQPDYMRAQVMPLLR
jgi:pimeloyl-ACP methyl ester carboxylesterase